MGRLGFHLDERSIRRAGSYYWKYVQVQQHENLKIFRRPTTDRFTSIRPGQGRPIPRPLFPPRLLLFSGARHEDFPHRFGRVLTPSMAFPSMMTCAEPESGHRGRIVLYDAVRHKLEQERERRSFMTRAHITPCPSEEGTHPVSAWPVFVSPHVLLDVHIPFCAHKCGYCDFASVAGQDDLIDLELTPWLPSHRDMSRQLIPLSSTTPRDPYSLCRWRNADLCGLRHRAHRYLGRLADRFKLVVQPSNSPSNRIPIR